MPKTRVGSVFPRKHGPGWQVSYYVDGKKKQSYREDEESARNLAAELERKFAGENANDQPTAIDTQQDGTQATHWLQMLWHLAQKVKAQPALDEHQRALKAISAAAQAAKQYLDIGEIEKKLAYETEWRERLQKQQNYGADSKVTRIHPLAGK